MPTITIPSGKIIAVIRPLRSRRFYSARAALRCASRAVTAKLRYLFVAFGEEETGLIEGLYSLDVTLFAPAEEKRCGELDRIGFRRGPGRGGLLVTSSVFARPLLARSQRPKSEGTTKCLLLQ